MGSESQVRRRHRRERRDAEGEVWVRSGISRVWARYAGQRKRVRRSGTKVGAWVVEQIGWFNSLCLRSEKRDRRSPPSRGRSYQPPPGAHHARDRDVNAEFAPAGWLLPYGCSWPQVCSMGPHTRGDAMNQILEPARDVHSLTCPCCRWAVVAAGSSSEGAVRHVYVRHAATAHGMAASAALAMLPSTGTRSPRTERRVQVR
jgi:hypothetical protein